VFPVVFGVSFKVMRFAVPEMGWASFKNDVLLASASGKFDVLVTTDQRLSYQQNVSGFEITVVVLVARRNKLEFLLPLVPQLVKVLEKVKPGEVHPSRCLTKNWSRESVRNDVTTVFSATEFARLTCEVQERAL